MAILSKRLIGDVGREYHRACGLRACFLGQDGRVLAGEDVLAELSAVRRKRTYALQESVSRGEPFLSRPALGVAEAIVCLEDRRTILGGLCGGAVLLADDDADEPAVRRRAVEYLAAHGLGRDAAEAAAGGLAAWPEDRVREAATLLADTFYRMSGWQPELMRENRLRSQQQEQINAAIEDQRRKGRDALYAFEKERALLAHIRAGDRGGARSMLNEMLAVIYLSSPRLVVLRARAIELMSCLTRAAIEDNPLMEPLIERNHTWTERLVVADSFEALSQVLMDALDDFMEGVYLHGANRSNARVHQALDFIRRNFSRPLSLAIIAREVGLSPGRLCHLVKQHTGRTVVQIVRQVRIDHARQLLTRTSRSCAEVAYEVGFSDESYFIRHFRRLTGTTPGRFRRGAGVPQDG